MICAFIFIIPERLSLESKYFCKTALADVYCKLNCLNGYSIIIKNVCGSGYKLFIKASVSDKKSLLT